MGLTNEICTSQTASQFTHLVEMLFQIQIERDFLKNSLLITSHGRMTWKNSSSLHHYTVFLTNVLPGSLGRCVQDDTESNVPYNAGLYRKIGTNDQRLP